MIDTMFNTGLTVIVVMVYICVVFILSMFADTLADGLTREARKYTVTLVFILLSITTILTCPKVIAWIWS